MPDQIRPLAPQEVDQYLAKAEPAREAARRLLKKHDPNSLKDAIDLETYYRKAPQPVGHPKHYGPHELMEIWLHVQIGTTLSGLSVNKFCRKAPFRFMGVGPHGLEVLWEIGGPTLRRVYYQAVAELKKERVLMEGYRRAMGDRAKDWPPEEFVGEAEKFWLRQRDERLKQYREVERKPG